MLHICIYIKPAQSICCLHVYDIMTDHWYWEDHFLTLSMP